MEGVEGVHFITMELVKGTTLAELLPRQGFALDRFFDIAVALETPSPPLTPRASCIAILKPGNVMVDPDGRVKVLDFGLAKASDRLAEAGAPRAILHGRTDRAGCHCRDVQVHVARAGARRTVDARSDIFSLGIVF